MLNSVKGKKLKVTAKQKNKKGLFKHKGRKKKNFILLQLCSIILFIILTLSPTVTT